MPSKNKQKGLTDNELIKKYEKGKINLAEVIKKTILPKPKKKG